ncbi:hypothetical protein C8F04DRAFT_1358052 [Mycena alexandri]|uniref:Uncharacterized protein n=1 Tax=Mycena alexandri TaxID=1745969 RepID=A0AAD6X1Q6_9AGAR|nr:hypothetical protein C8F04DRAFT_1358052 [Mycena alexandri]
MADTEFRAPGAFEPTFVKPLDGASRRRSRASHDSAAASTRSWVLMTQQSPPPPAEPIPIPDPVPALTPATVSRPLPEPPRRTSAVDEPGAEHMAVEVPNPSQVGYQWTTGRGAKAREARAHKDTHREGKGFVGGFVSGLKRLPHALVRTRRPRGYTTNTEGTDGTEGTGVSGNTLPRYVSNPPTPVVPTTGSALGFVRGVLATPGAQVTATPNVDGERRRRHPSFRVVPPEEDVHQGIVTPVVCDPDPEHGEGEAMPGALEFPQSSMENPYDREPISAPAPTASPHLSRVDDRLAAAADVDGDEPASVHVHPLPTVDYRRMSVHDATRPQSRTTITSAFTSDSPSFSSELHGFRRFFHALHVLPWVATDRVTVDYFPPRAKTKESVSWYHPEAQSASRNLEQPRDSAPSSPPLESGRANHNSPRTSPRHRTHRHAATSVDTPAPSPPAGYGYPFAYYPAFSPSPPPTQPTHGSRRAVSPRPRSPRAHSSHARRHHRRSATYHPSPAQWIPPPLLPAPPAPMYIIQATPSPPASPPPHPHTPSQQSHPGTASPGATQGDSPTARHAVATQMLAPVYMQIQVVPGAGGSPQFAFLHPQGHAHGGDAGYAAYAHSAGSPIVMSAPMQTVEAET